MSSHHFVREGQEPALFIVEPSSFDNIAPLLEWAPLVMVFGPSLESVLSWGVKIDVVLLGPADDIEKINATIQDQMPVKVLTCYKDQDPILAGLQELAKDQKAVNIALHTSADTFQKVLNFVKQINIVLLDNDVRWIPIDGTFQKWFPAKSIVRIKTNAHQPIKYTGLKQQSIDLFETIADGNITISSPDIFWVGETIV